MDAMRKSLLVALAGALALTACAKDAPKEPSVAVEKAWVRLPAVKGRPGAAYFTLVNKGPETRIISLTSPSARRIELHDSREENGVMRMGPLEDGTIPTESSLVFEPGGKHAMLFELAPEVAPGGTLSLTFTFDPAPPVTVEAHVMAAGDAAEHGGH